MSISSCVELLEGPQETNNDRVMEAVCNQIEIKSEHYVDHAVDGGGQSCRGSHGQRF